RASALLSDSSSTRRSSGTLVVPVVLVQDPEAMLNALIDDLRNGRRDRAYTKLGASFNTRRVLDGLGQADLTRLADFIASRALTDAAVRYLVREAPQLSCVRDLAAMLRRGARDEDANFPDSYNLGVGRFFFHFLPRLNRDAFAGVHAEGTCPSDYWGLQIGPV